MEHTTLRQLSVWPVCGTVWRASNCNPVYFFFCLKIRLKNTWCWIIFSHPATRHAFMPPGIIRRLLRKLRIGGYVAVNSILFSRLSDCECFVCITIYCLSTLHTLYKVCYCVCLKCVEWNWERWELLTFTAVLNLTDQLIITVAGLS